MYAERKTTVRLYLCGIGSLICAGFSLGWTALRSAAARGAVMGVFGCTGLAVVLYLTKVTRPRFRVPKAMRGKNRPDAYLMGSGAFDPERGQAVQQARSFSQAGAGQTNPLTASR